MLPTSYGSLIILSILKDMHACLKERIVVVIKQPSDRKANAGPVGSDIELSRRRYCTILAAHENFN